MFKNKKRLFIIVLVIAVVLVIAGSASADSNGALVLLHLDGCTVFDADWNFVEVQGNASDDGVITITQSRNGNWSATCHGMLPEGSRHPDRAIIRDGYVTPPGAPPGWIGWCGIPFVTPTYTLDSVSIIQPSGRVTLSCKYGPKSEGGTWDELFGS
jgi:hypothetical protein